MKDYVLPVLFAVALVFGALYLMVRSTSHAPTDQADAPVTTQADVAPSPAARELETTLAPAPAPDLATLRANCVEEARSGKGLSASLNRACAEFAAASRAELPAPKQEPPPRSNSTPEFRSDKQARNAPAAPGNGLPYTEVMLADCEGRHGYGTIDYRRCRAKQAEDLRRQCRELTQRADRASSYERQKLRMYARSYCRESDRYRVTD